MTDEIRFLGTSFPDLQLLSFSGDEALSSIYVYHLRCFSDSLNLHAKDMIGKKGNFWIWDDAGNKRYFAGIARNFRSGPLTRSNRREYFLEVVPDFYRTTQSIKTRVFEDKTTVDIVKIILGEYGITNKVSLTGTYIARDYCAQYNETDFAFVSRLLEDEGIGYYFTHSSSGETIQFFDSASGYGDCPEKDVNQTYSTKIDTHIGDWSESYTFHTGSTEMFTYSPLTAKMLNTTVKGKTDGAKNAGSLKKTIYRSPVTNEKTEMDFLKHFTTMRMQEPESTYDISNGKSNYRTFAVGCKFKFKEHDIADNVGKEYVITQISHSASEEENITGRKGGHYYQNMFACIPSNVVFRPARVTVRPRINGLLTGVVVSQSADGPEIDEHGRLKIKLHGHDNEPAHCLARVSQTFAGKKWGSFVVPDIDHEVLVSFIDGDPDNPVIVGSVYNGANKIPLNSGGGKATQMGWKTSNGQEMTIENKKDNEKIYFHSVKDYETIVDNDAKKVVKKNKSLEITEGDDKIEIKQGKRTTTIEKDDSTTLKSGNHDLKVSMGNHTVNVDTGKADMTVMQGITITSKQEIKLVVGPNSIKIDMQGIELKTPTASIKLDVAGKVESHGLQVETKADLTLKMEGNISAELKSPLMTTVEGGVKADLKSNVMTTVQGSVMANISGAIAKIN